MSVWHVHRLVTVKKQFVFGIHLIIIEEGNTCNFKHVNNEISENLKFSFKVNIFYFISCVICTKISYTQEKEHVICIYHTH